MKTARFTYRQDGGYYLGFLNDYPDYQTQGLSKEKLVKNLKDLLVDLESGESHHEQTEVFLHSPAGRNRQPVDTFPTLKPSTTIRGFSPRVSASASSVRMVCRSRGINAT